MNIIKRIREASKLNQLELSKILGVTRECVSNYENFKRTPRWEIAQKLLEIADKHGIKAKAGDILTNKKKLPLTNKR